MLCTVCQAIFRGKLKSEIYEEKWHQPTVEALYEAALEHCWICDQLWRGLVREIERHHEPSSDWTIDERSRAILACLSTGSPGERPFSRRRLYGDKLKIFIHEPGNGPAGTKLVLWRHFYLVSSKSKKIANLLPDQPSDNSYGQDWPLSQAKSWLAECIDNHRRCTKPAPAKPPTRLLELPENSNSSRVIETKDGIENIRYMTLSHCWGVAKTLSLTSESKARLSLGILVLELPQTFQDAIKVAHFLGVKYLWIDSLCIIQDSVEDWMLESSRMGDVYKNAICNIAATASEDSYSGLFHPRVPSLIFPCMVQSDWESELEADPVLNDEWHLLSSSFQDFVTHGLLDGPLLSRAWVVQERVLAPRTLHFGPNQLYWECYEHDACETYPKGIPHRMERDGANMDSFKRNSPRFGSKITDETIWRSAGTSTRPVCHISGFWRRIVNSYSVCDLTKEEDKLVALSGVVQEIQNLYKIKFAAGILEADPISLLWYVTGSARRPKNYRAPSWSWASLDGAVESPIAPYYEVASLVDILEVTVEPIGSDPNGQLKGGRISLRGPLSTIQCEKSEGTELKPWKVFINGRSLPQVHDWLVKPDLDGIPGPNLHCMPICRILHSHSDLKDSIWCLLLQPTNRERGEFRRFGIVQIASPHGWHWSWCQHVLGLSDWKDFENEDYMEYKEFDGEYKYTITVI